MLMPAQEVICQLWPGAARLQVAVITWTQGTDTTFQFYDADGELLTLNAGRSYLALVSSVTGQELTVTSSAGENLIQ